MLQSLRKLMLALFASALVLGFASDDVSAQIPAYKDLYDWQVGFYPLYPDVLAQGKDGNLYGTLPSGNVDLGSAFYATPSGAVTIFRTFDGSVGCFPWSGLTLGSDGNFYGSTTSCGANFAGLVFQLTPPPAGALTSLCDFYSGAGYPNSAPVQGKDGNFYGIVQQSAYKVSASGICKLLTSLIPGNSSAPLIQGADGNFYGTVDDVLHYDGAVFSMSPTGVVKTIYVFDATHGSHPYGPLVQDAKGYFYGTTYQGGLYDGGVVFKLTKGGVLTVLHDFNSATGYLPYAGLVLGTDGNLYGSTDSGGGFGHGVLFKITKSGTYTVQYDFDLTHGAQPDATAMQHTNGKIYGLTHGGGANGGGVFYSLDVGIKAFVSLMMNTGKAGQIVEILGQGFTGTTKVMFGKGSANFTVVSDTDMTAVVPTSGTTGFVTVTTPSGTLTSSKTFKVLPVISSFTPTSGPVGTQVTIAGSGFIGATKVTFGGVKATSYTVDSGTQITATVPTGAKTGKIAVTTPGGTASKGTFTVT